MKIKRIGNDNYKVEGKDLYLQRIIGGICWPGSKPGFACVLGEVMSHRPPYEYHLLGEVEALTLDSLLQGCLSLQGETFVQEFRGPEGNQEFLNFWLKKQRASKIRPPYFFSEKENFPFQISLLRDALNTKNKSLFLSPESKLPSYLLTLPNDLSSLKAEYYPAVTALGHSFGYFKKHEYFPAGQIPTEAPTYDPFDYL